MKPRKHYHDRYHRGSSLLFLGFSVIAFIISYGIIFYLAPQILGQFYSSIPCSDITNSDWEITCDETEAVTRWLVPLIPTVGIFIFIVKVLMVASVRGRD